VRLPGPAWCAVLVSLLGAVPLLTLAIPMSSDGMFHLYRVWELDRLWRDGVWYPSWAPDFYFSYGYPLFHYTPILPYGTVEVFHLLGLDLPGAMRVVLALGLPASACTAYILARSIVHRWPAMLAATAYALAPYHLLNLYGRTDLPEYLAAIWFPLLLWALVSLSRAPSREAVVVLALCTAGLLLTHNLSALMFFPVASAVGAAAIVLALRRGLTPSLLLIPFGAVLGAGAAAFFWIPAIADRDHVQFDRLLHSYDYAANFLSTGQLLSHDAIQQYVPVFSFSRATGYQFALWQSVAVASSMLLIPCFLKRRDAMARLFLVGSPLVCVALLVMATPFSEPLWTRWPMLTLAQFPWRFLGVAALPAGLCVASLIELLSERYHPSVALGGALVIAVASLAALHPMNTIVTPDAMTPEGYARFELQYRLVGTSAAGEYLPVSVTGRAETSPRAFALATGDSIRRPPGGPYPYTAQYGLNRRYDIDREAAGTVTLDTLAFSGWSATVDGVPAVIQGSAGSGLVSLSVPGGHHVIELSPSLAPLWKGAGIVSLASAILLVAVVPWRAWAVAVRLQPIAPAIALSVVMVLAVGLGMRQPATARAVFADGSALNVVPPALSERRSGAGVGTSLTLPITYTWKRSSTKVPLAAYFRLVSSDQQVWAGSLGPEAPDRDSGTATVNLALPGGTPPGVYTLEAGLVPADDPGTSQTLPLESITSSGGLPLHGALPVASIVVTRSGDAGTSPAVRTYGDVMSREAVSFALQVGSRWQIAEPGNVAAPCPSADHRSDALCFAAGTDLQVALPWHNLAINGRTLTETLRLVDALGAVIASVDREPAGGRYPSRFWQPGERVVDRVTLPVPSYVPPGAYTLVLIASLDGQPLNLLDATGKFTGIEDALATVTLSAATYDVTFTDVDPPVPPMPHRDAGLDIRLRGSLITPLHLQAGEQLHVRTLWAATTTTGTDALLRLTLRGGEDASLPLMDAPPVPSYGSSHWLPGVPVLSQVAPRIPATAGKGRYAVEAVLHAAGTDGPVLSLGTVDVDPLPTQVERQPANVINASFGGAMLLAGFDPALPMTLRAGTPYVVTLFWRGERPLGQSYAISLQLIDTQGKLVAQHDSRPDDGKKPTSAWVPGRLVLDPHALAVPELPPGDFRLLVVVYDPATGNRLRLADGADSLTLTPVKVGV